MHPYVTCMYPYVTRTHSYVTCMFPCVNYSYVTRMHPHVTCMYPYVTRILLVCIRMYLCVLVCYSDVNHMYLCVVLYKIDDVQFTADSLKSNDSSKREGIPLDARKLFERQYELHTPKLAGLEGQKLGLICL